MLGADCVGENSFVNKIGSGTLLKAAREFEVKSAVVFESLKIKDVGIASDLRRDYKGSEVWRKNADKKIRIINKYFEIIANHKADLFISDLGADNHVSLKNKIIEKGRF